MLSYITLSAFLLEAAAVLLLVPSISCTSNLVPVNLTLKLHDTFGDGWGGGGLSISGIGKTYFVEAGKKDAVHVIEILPGLHSWNYKRSN